MKHARYIVPIVLLTAIVGCMQLFALYASKEILLLMEYRFDKIQHFLAGNACGIFGIWCFILYRGGKVSTKDHHGMLLGATISALIIGIAWEILEHTFPVMNGGAHSYVSLDTIFDVFCDVMGGYVAGLFFVRKVVI